MILKLLVPQWELCFFLKMTRMYLLKLLPLKPCKGLAVRSVINTLRTGQELSALNILESKGKKIKLAAGKTFLELRSTSSQCPVTAISLGQQRKVSLGNSPPSSQSGNAFLSSGEHLPLCPWEPLHSLGFYMFSYMRQQSSFSIPGVPKVQGPGLRTTTSPSLGDR